MPRWRAHFTPTSGKVDGGSLARDWGGGPTLSAKLVGHGMSPIGTKQPWEVEPLRSVLRGKADVSATFIYSRRPERDGVGWPLL